MVLRCTRFSNPIPSSETVLPIIELVLVWTYTQSVALVVFTKNLQRHVECPPTHAPGSTVREVLDSIFRDIPLLRGYIVNERGSLRKHMTIFVDGELIADRQSLSDTVSSDSEIYVMQALSGG